MPVVVQQLNPATEQDLIDLGKIYQDAPNWLLPPYADAQQLIEQSLAQGTLIVARFNDRLLGAAVLQPAAEGWQLSHLCVRRVTRGRGVGSRLIDEAQRMAAEAGQALHFSAPDEHLKKAR